ncbi:MAG: beta-N-acetylhexosaminidase [Bacteroidales bacterium]|nr:beta-N-acetylhexosaminidase [Bacteroidales bacterium]MDD5912431.1 beta-N-acetylhexosaminidase [Bacteroidales bacterium]
MKKFFYIILAIALAVSCTGSRGVDGDYLLDIIPYPEDVTIRSGSFNAAGATFHCDPLMDEASRNVASKFAARLSEASGKPSEVIEGRARAGFNFIVDNTMRQEEYSLSISRKAVEIKASDLNGFNYAIQTLKQMLPEEIFGSKADPDEEWEIHCAVIKDAPRFAYRGMHLDVSRHFFSVEEVKRYLDVMEVHKLNRLHWHLTDDQGWRVEIKKYPELTSKGSIRKETIVGHLKPSDNTFDGVPYGKGLWYTQEQIREVVAYAAAKGITIVPEIDLPGHMVAALACYPELGCTSGPYDVWTLWGVADDVLCPGNEKTFEFIENVLDEIVDMFPSEYIHIGGDECPKVRWEKCPKCQARIKELGLKGDGAHSAEHFLQSYVTARVEAYLATKGRKIIGWDEILEGELAPNATVMSWRGIQGGLAAAKLGHDAIMTPNSHMYFDYYQSENQDAEPLSIGGYLPVSKVYSYEPFEEGMSEEEKSHIIGVQANLWTEYITTDSHLEYMLLPRLAALSEVQWCQPEVKNWERFLESVDDICEIYDEMGYNYARHLLDD